MTALEDWEFFARIALTHPFQGIRYIDQVLGDYYYYHEASAPTVTNETFNGDDARRAFGIGENSPKVAELRVKLAAMAKARAREIDGPLRVAR